MATEKRRFCSKTWSNRADGRLYVVAPEFDRRPANRLRFTRHRGNKNEGGRFLLRETGQAHHRDALETKLRNEGGREYENRLPTPALRSETKLATP